MEEYKKKPSIRLNVKELQKAAIDQDLNSDKDLAEKLNISVTQLWRIKQHNRPGPTFIANVLLVFKGPFERFFFLDK